jgi:hypothetical protein
MHGGALGPVKSASVLEESGGGAVRRGGGTGGKVSSGTDAAGLGAGEEGGGSLEAVRDEAVGCDDGVLSGERARGPCASDEELDEELASEVSPLGLKRSFQQWFKL